MQTGATLTEALLRRDRNSLPPMAEISASVEPTPTEKRRHSAKTIGGILSYILTIVFFALF